MRKKSLFFGGFIFLMLALVIFTGRFTSVSAAEKASKDINLQKEIEVTGSYANWDGTCNVSQFVNGSGKLCLATDEGDYVFIYETVKNKVKLKLKLKKVFPLFGAAVGDEDGFYYVMTGYENEDLSQKVNTVNIAKYDKKGTLVASVYDDGSSSLASYYNNGFYTRLPFDAGNCSIAVNGDYLAVNYGRSMYSGHQSNSVFMINRKNMTEVYPGSIYNSHSFAQRIIPFGTGFASVSEGDCYPRAFSLSVTSPQNSLSKTYDLFHFWVKKGSLDRWDMYAVNNNFAHMGNIVNLKDKYVALVGTSVKSLNEKAEKQKEQIFIQIFNPEKNADSASAYVTKGTRKGLSGGNGDENVTDYGVKWLTSYSSAYSIGNTTAVADTDGNTVVLYELYKNNAYKGVYMIVVDIKGNVTTKKTAFSKKACLTQNVPPICVDKTVYWFGNRYGTDDEKIYLYSLKY